MNTEIKILLLYLTQEGRVVYLDKLVNKFDAMASEEYFSNGFLNIYGGIEIVIDDCCVILHVTDFSYLIKVTDFLLNSLYWLKEKDCDWFNPIESEQIVLKTIGGHNIKLQKSLAKKEVILSFYPSDLYYVKKRSDKFFENISIDQHHWISAVEIALQEYFFMIENEILKDGTNTDKILERYMTVWNGIK